MVVERKFPPEPEAVAKRAFALLVWAAGRTKRSPWALRWEPGDKVGDYTHYEDIILTPEGREALASYTRYLGAEEGVAPEILGKHAAFSLKDMAVYIFLKEGNVIRLEVAGRGYYIATEVIVRDHSINLDVLYVPTPPHQILRDQVSFLKGMYRALLRVGPRLPGDGAFVVALYTLFSLLRRGEEVLRKEY